MSKLYRALRSGGVLAVLIALVSGAAPGGRGAALAAGTISGTIFQDYNGNGARDLNASLDNFGGGQVRKAIDRGLGGVTVTAYDRTGAAVGSATSAPDGRYTLSASGAGPYRIEFSNLPQGFEPGPVGANNGSTVRFVGDGATPEVDLGIILPGEYCQDNPDLLTSCFRAGPQQGVSVPGVLSFPYSAGSSLLAPLEAYKEPVTHTVRVAAEAAGTIWGMDYARTRGVVYAGAFFKKHAGFGPGADGRFDSADDAGAVYLLDRASGQVTGGFTVPNATANAHDVNDYITDNYDQAWDAVGKISLGGMALSEDEATLYVMNLEERALYALNALTGAVLGSVPVPGTGGSPVAAPPLPAAAPGAPPLPGTCAADAIRPFAVEYERGQLYVSLTCTAEGSATVDSYTEANGNGRFDHSNLTERSSVVDRDGNGVYNQGDARQLRAYIYRADPATLAFEAAPYFQLALNYPRGIANANGQPPAAWRPWVPGFSLIEIGERTIYYPQPWLTDLTFDGPNLLLLLRDRTGDTTGYQAPSNPNAPPSTLYDGVGVGDVLRACPDASGQLVLESGGSCGGIQTTPSAGGPALQPQGPGGGEYYFDDGYGITGGSTVNHDEVGTGGSTAVPGHPDVVISHFDAYPWRGIGPSPDEVFNGGFRWFDNTTGALEKGYVIYDSDGLEADPLTFGKANGLGDLIVLCDQAPIEIGNRVWRDDNLNGVQDPGEPPLANVSVELYQGATLIGTAVTDAGGNYLFSAYSGATTGSAIRGMGLLPNTQYTVRIPNATGLGQQPALSGLQPTVPNSGGAVRDSDGIRAGTAVEVTLTTGRAGANNHTYDFGFVAQPTAIVLVSFTARLAGAGAVVSWRTSMELDTQGFNLYRSATGRRADSVRVNPWPIKAEGNLSTGASYTFIDATASEGPYSYWLEEIVPGGSQIYGPVSTDQLANGERLQVWLPRVTR